jgi:uncharacterized membrane protein
MFAWEPAVPEVVIAFVLLALTAASMVAAIVLSIIALVKVRRARGLLERVERLERAIEAMGEAEPAVDASGVAVPGQPQPAEARAGSAPTSAAAPTPERRRRRIPLPAIRLPADIDWESLIGRRGLGWLAVVVLIFAVAFFLRHAFENRWIGPLGRVATGIVAGAGLVVAGWRYHRRDWRVFAQMLTAAGLVILYLATYASFGFYRLIPQWDAAVFMFVLVVEGAALAVRYESPAVALMTLAGGLLTPLLMGSSHDQYLALFTYLAMLNIGVVLLAVWRHWRVLGMAALAGTHGLYWIWYADNYHPDKLVAALGFHGVLFALYLGHSVATQWIDLRRVGWPELLFALIAPFAYFGAVFVLLDLDHHQWLGTVAIVLAAAYVVVCRLLLTPRQPLASAGPSPALSATATEPPAEIAAPKLAIAALAVAVGFIALAFPIQADAQWVALGWAIEAAALWWFGCRVNVRTLRAIAAGLFTLASGRLFAFDTPRGWRDPFIPILNEYGLPAVLIVASMLGSVIVARRFHDQLSRAERFVAGLGGLASLLLLLFILSIETIGFFNAQSLVQLDPAAWRWSGQVALSVLWGGYAAALLAIGFRRDRAALRWLALMLFAMTAGKVFLVDMAQLQAFYRILAFLALAVLLALAARAYQRPATPKEVAP